MMKMTTTTTMMMIAWKSAEVHVTVVAAGRRIDGARSSTSSVTAIDDRPTPATPTTPTTPARRRLGVPSFSTGFAAARGPSKDSGQKTPSR